MTEDDGFEPPPLGFRDRCLTTWLILNVAQVFIYSRSTAVWLISDLGSYFEPLGLFAVATFWKALCSRYIGSYSISLPLLSDDCNFFTPLLRYERIHPLDPLRCIASLYYHPHKSTKIEDCTDKDEAYYRLNDEPVIHLIFASS